LKIIVLPISYFSLLVKLDAASDSWRVKNYIIYYGINISNGMAYHTEMLSNKLSVNVKRIISFYLKRNTAITCSSLGWGVSYNSKNARDLVETGKDSAKRQTILDFKYFNDIVSTLKSIIEFGRMYNIKIVLFTPPAYETYFENLNKEQLKKTIQTAEDISNQFENCMYFNFLENKSFTKLDFFDADHLNENGAEKLTLLINNKIKDIK
jgi:predicted ribosome quality control (RQC) complex YloA/Tae2 family protein